MAVSKRPDPEQIAGCLQALVELVGKIDLKKYGGITAYHYLVLRDTSGALQLLSANCNWIKRHEKTRGIRDARKILFPRNWPYGTKRSLSGPTNDMRRTYD